MVHRSLQNLHNKRLPDNLLRFSLFITKSFRTHANMILFSTSTVLRSETSRIQLFHEQQSKTIRLMPSTQKNVRPIATVQYSTPEVESRLTPRVKYHEEFSILSLVIILIINNSDLSLRSRPFCRIHLICRRV